MELFFLDTDAETLDKAKNERKLHITSYHFNLPSSTCPLLFRATSLELLGKLFGRRAVNRGAASHEMNFHSVKLQHGRWPLKQSFGSKSSVFMVFHSNFESEERGFVPKRFRA